MDNTKMRTITDVLEKLSIDDIKLSHAISGNRVAVYVPTQFTATNCNWQKYVRKMGSYWHRYDNAEFFFDYDKNTLLVKFQKRELVCSLVNNTKFTDYYTLYIENFEIDDSDFDEKTTIDLLNTACWVFNHSPEPLF